MSMRYVFMRHEETGFDDKDGDVRSSSGIGASCCRTELDCD